MIGIILDMALGLILSSNMSHGCRSNVIPKLVILQIPDLQELTRQSVSMIPLLFAQL
jgi:hypothetical protein